MSVSVVEGLVDVIAGPLFVCTYHENLVRSTRRNRATWKSSSDTEWHLRKTEESGLRRTWLARLTCSIACLMIDELLRMILMILIHEQSLLSSSNAGGLLQSRISRSNFPFVGWILSSWPGIVPSIYGVLRRHRSVLAWFFCFFLTRPVVRDSAYKRDNHIRARYKVTTTYVVKLPYQVQSEG